MRHFNGQEEQLHAKVAKMLRSVPEEDLELATEQVMKARETGNLHSLLSNSIEYEIYKYNIYKYIYIIH